MRIVRRSTISPDAAATAAARAAAEAAGLDFGAFSPIPPTRARKPGAPIITWTSDTTSRAIVVTIGSEGPSAIATPGMGGGRAPRDTREDFIRVRVTKAEKSTLEQAALRAGRELSPWLRDLGMIEAAR